MTLYWWTHWFWITPLKIYVVFAVLCWSSAVNCMSLPFVNAAAVQNGHQNGPYVTKSLDIPEKIIIDKSRELPKFHTASYQEIAHYSTDEVSAQSSASTEEQSTTVAVDLKDDTQESTSEEYITFSNSTDESTSVDPHLLFPFRSSPLVPVDTESQSVQPFPLADTNDKDDTSHGFLLPNLTNAENSNDTVDSPGVVEDSKIVWISTKPSITEDKQKKDTSQEKDKEDEPMSDGPYSPWGSFKNSSNLGVKATVSTTVDSVVLEEKVGNIGVKSRTISTTTDFVLPEESISHLTGKTVNRERTSESALNTSWSEQGWNETDGDGRGVVPVSKERVGPASEPARLHAASIAGIALGIIAAAASIGAVSYGLYRRRYLNKPQTLNDSNPDSSGYLDDSTLRENSEEMYSLDNDSFLNSLEAMTIQNYWTDSVKHTKL